MEHECSVGALVIAPEEIVYPDELMREADRLMYAAERRGKGRLRLGTHAPSMDPELLPLVEAIGELALPGWGIGPPEFRCGAIALGLKAYGGRARPTRRRGGGRFARH